MCSSGGSSTTTIPPELLAAYQGVVGSASNFYNKTPSQAYSNNPNAFVAGLTPTQEAGISNINATAGQAQPYYNLAGSQLAQGQQSANTVQSMGLGSMIGGYNNAQGYNQAAAGDIMNAQQMGANQINKFQSPYIQSVLQGTAGMLNQQNQQAAG
jgi:hypothetical protein